MQKLQTRIDFNNLQRIFLTAGTESDISIASLLQIMIAVDLIKKQNDTSNYDSGYGPLGITFSLCPISSQWDVQDIQYMHHILKILKHWFYNGLLHFGISFAKTNIDSLNRFEELTTMFKSTEFFGDTQRLKSQQFQNQVKQWSQSRVYQNVTKSWFVHTRMNCTCMEIYNTLL